jgi:hypothetical protein
VSRLLSAVPTPRTDPAAGRAAGPDTVRPDTAAVIG